MIVSPMSQESRGKERKDEGGREDWIAGKRGIIYFTVPLIEGMSANLEYSEQSHKVISKVDTE